MSRYIDADALIESIKNTADLGGWIGEALYQIKQVAIKYIDSAPTIEPKRGEWKGDKCSVCGNERAWYGCNPPFCPDCGAEMREREGE